MQVSHVLHGRFFLREESETLQGVQRVFTGSSAYLCNFVPLHLQPPKHVYESFYGKWGKKLLRILIVVLCVNTDR